jgi:hypothetical protein
MRPIIGGIVAASALGVGFVLASSASVEGARPSMDRASLRVLSHTVQSEEIDVGASGLSLGDQLVFADRLTANGQRVGSDHGSCMVTKVVGDEVTAQCVVTLLFDHRGQIATQGIARFGSDPTPTFTLAVTGGTGHFNGATGQLKVHERSQTDAVLNVMLRR